MRKSLVFGRSNRADVGGARSRKQDENKIYGERDGDGQPSVRKIEDKRQVGALREQMRSLPADGEAQNATGRTDSPRRRFAGPRLSFCGKGVPSAAEIYRLPMRHTIESLDESALTGRRFFLLFLLLLTTLILYPYADATVFGYYAFRVIGSSAILISVYAANFRRSLLIFVLVLAVPALMQRFLLPRAHVSSFSIANMALSFIFDVVVVVMIFRHVFAREQANSETVFGALCIYLLVGFSFASVYHMVSVIQPNAFYLDPHANFHTVPDRFDFIYYSFGTMTSLGAAGITPVSAHARAISVLEAILGVLYLAVLVARLMGAYRPGSKL